MGLLKRDEEGAEILTAKQKLFVDEYLKDLNGTRAAIKAGYSEESAAVIASENLKKPYIRKYIDTLLAENTISAEETVKLISDISKSSINDYLTLTVREKRTKVKKPLAEKIKELKNLIKKERMVCTKLNWQAERLAEHTAHVLRIDEEIVRLEVDLLLNPDAYIIDLSEPELVESAEIDMVKLAKDKQFGRIKSMSFTEFGPKVELYAADAALTNMAKIHGKFEKDNNQKQPVINVGFTNTDDDE